MEGNPPPGEDLLTSRLPSLPPPPQEISPELVSPLSLPGQAPHAEGSADLRVSPLIAVAPRHGTTSLVTQHLLHHQQFSTGLGESEGVRDNIFLEARGGPGLVLDPTTMRYEIPQ